MSKKSQLIGFVYSSSKSDLREPIGAFVAGKGFESGDNYSKVSISEFKDMVADGHIKDMKLKDGELILNVMRKGHRSSGNKGALDAIGGLGETATYVAAAGGAMHSLQAGAAAAGAAQAAQAATLSSHEAELAALKNVNTALKAEPGALSVLQAESVAQSRLVAEGMSAKAAYTASKTSAEVVAAKAAQESAGVAVKEAEAVLNATKGAAGVTKDAAWTAAHEAEIAANSTGILLPMVIAATAATAIYVTTKAVTGAVTRHKVYEYVPIRMVDCHLEKASKSSTHIAVCVSGFQRELDGLTLTMFLYGANLKDFMIQMMSNFPELGGNMSVPKGGIACITLPYSVLANPKFYAGYNLMFNTINFYDEEVSQNICKQTKFSKAQINKIAVFLDGVTDKSLVATEVAIETTESTVPTSEEEAKQSGMSNVQAYCQKYDITEEQFRDTEVPRLCAILGCEESNIEENIGQLVFQ